MIPGELAQALKHEALARQQAEQEQQRAERAEQELADLKARLKAKGIELDGESS